jgi:site-specific DNA-methyltransferase (adenine-specific)
MRAYLHCGDNFAWLKTLPGESVDLCYIDPPFSSDINYSIVTGNTKIKAFKDKWKWSIADMVLNTILEERKDEVGSWARGMSIALGACGMYAYLIFIANRLIEIKRVLKPTGTIYVHCDQSANFHIRFLMNAVFGKKSFRNEIIWCNGAGKPSKKDFPRKHDSIFRYTKGDIWTFNANDEIMRIPFSDMIVKLHFEPDENGRLFRRYPSGKISYADEGKLVQDYWVDIDGQKARSPFAKEYTGFQTQKPVALAERIILASSNPGDMVMDCFMGTGTTGVAAVKNNRNFMGCDIMPLAVKMSADRLKELDRLPVIMESKE